MSTKITTDTGRVMLPNVILSVSVILIVSLIVNVAAILLNSKCQSSPLLMSPLLLFSSCWHSTMAILVTF